MIEKETIKVEIVLTQDAWGTVPLQTDIWHNYIAEKMKRDLKKGGKLTEEEINQEILETAGGVINLDETKQGLTGFYRSDKGIPCYRDYQLKGFLKNSAKVQKQFGVLKQLQNKVTNYLFIRGIGPARQFVLPDPIPHPVDEETGLLDLAVRPIRCETALGPRVSIARSEFFPTGTKFVFEIESLLGVFSLDNVKKLLDYSEFAGMGQSRQNQQGMFTYKIL